MLDMEARRNDPARIMVMGLGGGGSNAINRMISEGLRDVAFWVANTDAQALDSSICENHHQLGVALTGGLGAGGDPEIGRAAAEEDTQVLTELLEGYDMVFLTAGMGGGTGTGSISVIARIARSMGALTVAIVTRPFGFENRKRVQRADEGISVLAEEVDTMIVIPNDKLLHLVEREIDFNSGLRVADEILYQSTRGISDIITGNGLINVDFADVRTVMKNRGAALLGCGEANGESRALEAAQAAVSSPLLDDLTIQGAQAVLINIVGGPDMGFHEVTEAAQYITEQAGGESDVYWGAVVDPSLSATIRVTLIATGFQRSPAIRVVERPTREKPEPIVEPPEPPPRDEQLPPTVPPPAPRPQEPVLPAPRVVPLGPSEPFSEPSVNRSEALSTGATDILRERPQHEERQSLEMEETPAERWIEESGEGEPAESGHDRGPTLLRGRSARRIRLPDRLDGLESDGRNPLDIPTFLRKQMD